MIIGIGTDIVEIARIDSLIKKYANQFLEKVFTAAEIDYCGRGAQPALHFSGRWAIKEAFYKALPDECQRVSSWKKIEIISGSGRPVVVVCDRDLSVEMARFTIRRIHCSLSHEKSMCTGLVVLED